MTKPLTIAAAFIGTLALFYLFGAFVAWDWNAGNWPQDMRAAVTFVGAFVGALVAFTVGFPRHD